MKISLIMPTNRASYSAVARILEAASLDSDRFELIVRNNSEDAKKKAFLALIDSPSVRLFNAKNEGGFRNFVEALRLATGDFVFFIGDDDWFSTRGLEQLYSRASIIANDESFSAVTGDCVLETSKSTGIVRYEMLESNNAGQRLAGYLSARAPNVLFYSAVRRPLMDRCYRFLESVPYKLSFHDQLVALMLLVAGRVATVERVVYFYDLGIWETLAGTLEKDRSSYQAVGLPIEVDRLHWLICGFEGAFLLKSRLLSDFAYDRAQLLNIWFSDYFARFKHTSREDGYTEAPANAVTRRVRDKWINVSDADLNELLLDICDVFEHVDRAGAARYFDFWSTL